MKNLSFSVLSPSLQVLRCPSLFAPILNWLGGLDNLPAVISTPVFQSKQRKVRYKLRGIRPNSEPLDICYIAFGNQQRAILNESLTIYDPMYFWNRKLHYQRSKNCSYALFMKISLCLDGEKVDKRSQ